jgi:hypothetical protein
MDTVTASKKLDQNASSRNHPGTHLRLRTAM